MAGSEEDDLVTACPECGSSDLSERKRPYLPTWLCRECQAQFNDPTEREPKATGNLGSIGRAIHDADPDAPLDEIITPGAERGGSE